MFDDEELFDIYVDKFPIWMKRKYVIYELPYWEHIKISHLLDPTHICKNGSDEGDSGIGVMTLGTTEVENNQMGRPMVNPGKDNIAMYGALTFPKGRNEPGFPSGGRPWLVDSGNVSSSL